MINKERMELWIQALESDEHQQCTGVLRKRMFHDGPQMHCALGIGVLVAMEQGVSKYDELDNWIWDWSDLPPQVRQFYGLESTNPQVTINEQRNSIIDHNDGNGHSFWTIAQAMRAEFLKDES